MENKIDGKDKQKERKNAKKRRFKKETQHVCNTCFNPMTGNQRAANADWDTDFVDFVSSIPS
ncbi:MAG: hypothetical protein LBN29_12230 [Mediterranea sp.]|nr:hypothetical protein [Mediterranea sp.]